MLDKEICKRCVNDYVSHLPKHLVFHRWENHDESRWDRGFVVCPTSTGWHGYKKATALDQCPYALEHLMKEQTP